MSKRSTVSAFVLSRNLVIRVAKIINIDPHFSTNKAEVLVFLLMYIQHKELSLIESRKTPHTDKYWDIMKDWHNGEYFTVNTLLVSELELLRPWPFFYFLLFFFGQRAQNAVIVPFHPFIQRVWSSWLNKTNQVKSYNSRSLKTLYIFVSFKRLRENNTALKSIILREDFSVYLTVKSLNYPHYLPKYVVVKALRY
jgi:hypothetical protein